VEAHRAIGFRLQEDEAIRNVQSRAVDLTFSGSGNFVSSLTPVDGDGLSGVSLSNTIGSTKLTTFVYEADLNGGKVMRRDRRSHGLGSSDGRS
jgi:hypothetical protein